MPNRERSRIVVRGAVQGVGFRPFVYRLATELELDGCVLNSAQGVFLEIEGTRDSLDRFLLRFEKEKPPHAVIQSFESTFLDPINYRGFEIRESEEGSEKTALILPDIATCADCLREMLDPTDRRFRYPFTNCTNCGPRFSIIEALPYDRANTSMKTFTMCDECEREYRDPANRRFHAQPNGCHRCGPQLEMWNTTGEIIARGDEALERAIEAVRAEQILALKGLGGFQLIVDATNETAVVRLRERKHREEKPFAVMVPSLAAAQELCIVSELEARLLVSPEAPIVLLERSPAREHSPLPGRESKVRVLAASVAPGNPNLGVMLPYTPLHHLLMHSLGNPVVATSGNLSDEPICIDERDALQRLRGIADAFLVHDRPIIRHVDDSITRLMAGREMVLRRARGYAPLPIHLRESTKTILALGAHLKNTVALAIGSNVFVSQHIGDLATEQAYRAFVRSAADLPRLYDAKPELIACDMHPEYLSTKYASEFPTPKFPVQHHWAHVASCMAENEVKAPALGIVWDGTGYGLDGTVWGGEFLLAQENGFERVAHFRQFHLPGGDAAIKEPRRSALGLLHEILGDELWNQGHYLGAFSEGELKPMRAMLENQVHSPLTSSVGRLFDAVAALAGLRARSTFEGQAAMELEFALQTDCRESYGFELRGTNPIVVDWETAIRELLRDQEAEVSLGIVSAKFHHLLVEIIVAIAHRLGQTKVILSGGCFQNRYLTERAIARLRTEGFQPYWHQRVPPNDGGIALGQIAAAHWGAGHLV